MEKSVLLRKLLFSSLLLILALPLVVIFSRVQFQSLSWDPFLLEVLWGALVQSSLSTVATLVAGGLGCFGLMSLIHRIPSRLRSPLLFALLIPSFLPPLLVVGSVVKVVGFLPTGLWGVVFFHSLMNMSLAAVVLLHYVSHRAESWARFALVSGVPFRKFLFKGLLPQMFLEMQWIVFYFFVLYFFSFSIPFLVGGSVYGGIEVFIYEQVAFLGNWSGAAQYALLLFLLLFVISTFAKKQSVIDESPFLSTKPIQKYLGQPALIGCTILPIVLVVGGLLMAVPDAFSGFSQQGVWGALRGTLLIGLLVGLLIFIYLNALTFCFVNDRWSRWLLSFVHPGWVVVGFAFLLLPGKGPALDILKTSLALSIIYIPFLYRLSFHQKLLSLKCQVRTTRVMAVSWNKVFLQVIWPQCLETLCLLSGLGGLWACGDFAITGLLLQSVEVTTLGFEMKELLSNYRSEQAIQMMWPLLLVGGIVFILFQGLYYVGRKKTFSSV